MKRKQRAVARTLPKNLIRPRSCKPSRTNVPEACSPGAAVHAPRWDGDRQRQQQFKIVNDTYGHNVGDELLRQVAGRLLACVRICDTVCRYGGDEFVVMLPQIDAAEDAEVVCEKIRAHLAAPYAVGDEPLLATVSIGAALCREDGQTSSELIDRADAAMYLDKTQRKYAPAAISSDVTSARAP